MKCEIRIVSGARAGHHDVFDKTYIGIGRHPLSDVRLDAEQDLDASTRHAALILTGEQWMLRDLGSTNGTFVNGERITGDHPVHDGDTLRFGFHGPEATFHLVHEGEEVVMEAVHLPPRPSAPAEPKAATPSAPEPKVAPAPKPAEPKRAAARAPEPRAPSATSILRAELREQRGRLRAVLAAVVILFVGAAAVIIWQGRTSTEVQTQLVQRVESLTAEVAQLRTLQASADSEAAALRTQIASARDPSQADLLRRQLSDVERRSRGLVQAQTVNWSAVVRRNHAAVAILYVKFPDSSMWTGTGFSVSAAGQLLTNRHLVTNDAGQRAVEIAVQFSGSADVHPARVERVAPDADLAVVRLESAGPFPMVLGLADSAPSVGDPIGLLGFPLGTDLPQGAEPTASLFTGSISRTIPDSLLQLDAWSGTGASGSPIFNGNGRVIGVEFGGQRETAGRVVFGLPIQRAVPLLR
jgi:S1-C subfamily serine protease